jgi:hypothetical protein
MRKPLHDGSRRFSAQKIEQQQHSISASIAPSSAVNSKSVPRNREVPRDKRSRGGACSVPFPQRDRIKQKFMAGKNISAIAREEGRHWETVAKIVKEEDVLEHVKDLRARFYGALEEVLDAAIGVREECEGWRMACV